MNLHVTVTTNHDALLDLLKRNTPQSVLMNFRYVEILVRRIDVMELQAAEVRLRTEFASSCFLVRSNLVSNKFSVSFGSIFHTLGILTVPIVRSGAVAHFA